jgi:DNA-binding transcriptional LysR family regulator
MSLDAYRIFHEVGKAGNMTRASELLFISQPAVSKAIGQLEEQIGFPLFIRMAKGVELTSEGRIMFRYVQSAMDQIAAGEQMAEHLRKLDAGVVRIGISHTLCRHWFLPWLRQFHNLHPQLRIQVFNRTSPETARMLYAGELDFGIVSRSDGKDDFLFQELTTIEDIFVTNQKELVPDHPMPLGDITRFPLMLLEKENTSRLQLERHFAAQGVPLKAEIEISSMDFLIEFAKIGLGVAAVVRSFVTQELLDGELHEIPVIPPPGIRSVGILTKKDLPLSHAANAFIQYLVEGCAEM